MLPCALKYLLGLDCPLCGFQRSLLALLQGHWAESWALYPPLIPVLLLGMGWGLALLSRRWPGRTGLVAYTWVVLALVMLNYIVKLVVPGLHGHG